MVRHARKATGRPQNKTASCRAASTTVKKRQNESEDQLGENERKRLMSESDSPNVGSVVQASISAKKKAAIVCPEMVYYCFDTINRYLCSQSSSSGTTPIVSSKELPQFSDDSFPLFVTWHVGREKHLRGCIGTFSATPLRRGLQEFAIKSAFQDTRFSPITHGELSRLQCTVSLLIDFEPIDSFIDWEIGIHGIRLEFKIHGSSTYSATYLPDVAREQGWNHRQTIDSLIKKSGYNGLIDDALRHRVNLVRYRSQKITKTYADYRAAMGQGLKTVDVCA
ncbi:hypothetical protein ACOME3_006878 [Neoechinorhynchus agilis]